MTSLEVGALQSDISIQTSHWEMSPVHFSLLGSRGAVPYSCCSSPLVCFALVYNLMLYQNFIIYNLLLINTWCGVFQDLKLGCVMYRSVGLRVVTYDLLHSGCSLFKQYMIFRQRHPDIQQFSPETDGWVRRATLPINSTGIQFCCGTCAPPVCTTEGNPLLLFIHPHCVKCPLLISLVIIARSPFS